MHATDADHTAAPTRPRPSPARLPRPERPADPAARWWPRFLTALMRALSAWHV